MLISSSYLLFTVSSHLSVQSYRAARLNPRLTWDDPAYGMELMDLFEFKIPRHYGVQLHYICRDGYQTQDYNQRPYRPNYKSSVNHPWEPQVPTDGGYSFWMPSHERWLPPISPIISWYTVDSSHNEPAISTYIQLISWKYISSRSVCIHNYPQELWQLCYVYHKAVFVYMLAYW